VPNCPLHARESKNPNAKEESRKKGRSGKGTSPIGGKKETGLPRQEIVPGLGSKKKGKNSRESRRPGWRNEQKKPSGKGTRQ